MRIPLILFVLLLSSCRDERKGERVTGTVVATYLNHTILATYPVAAVKIDGGNVTETWRPECYALPVGTRLKGEWVGRWARSNITGRVWWYCLVPTK